jgi:two-component system nitrogen regulation response regulator GlnG
VRELENLARRLAALYPQDVIGEALVEAELGAGSAPLFAPPAPGDDGRRRSPAPAPAQITGDGFDAAMERAVSELFQSFGGANPQLGLYHRVLHDLEAPLIAATLTWTHGNQIKAAEILGLNRNTLRKKIRDLNLRGVASFR